MFAVFFIATTKVNGYRLFYGDPNDIIMNVDYVSGLYDLFNSYYEIPSNWQKTYNEFRDLLDKDCEPNDIASINLIFPIMGSTSCVCIAEDENGLPSLKEKVLSILQHNHHKHSVVEIEEFFDDLIEKLESNKYGFRYLLDIISDFGMF